MKAQRAQSQGVTKVLAAFMTLNCMNLTIWTSIRPKHGEVVITTIWCNMAKSLAVFEFPCFRKLLTPFKNLLLNIRKGQGACSMGLIETPSGDRVCFMNQSFRQTYLLAHEDCKSRGFYGLLEARNDEDAIFIGDITACKLTTKLTLGENILAYYHF